MIYEINRESLATSVTGSFEFNIVAQKVNINISSKLTNILANGTSE